MRRSEVAVLSAFREVEEARAAVEEWRRANKGLAPSGLVPASAVRQLVHQLAGRPVKRDAKGRWTSRKQAATVRVQHCSRIPEAHCLTAKRLKPDMQPASTIARAIIADFAERGATRGELALLSLLLVAYERRKKILPTGAITNAPYLILSHDDLAFYIGQSKSTAERARRKLRPYIRSVPRFKDVVAGETDLSLYERAPDYLKHIELRHALRLSDALTERLEAAKRNLKERRQTQEEIGIIKGHRDMARAGMRLWQWNDEHLPDGTLIEGLRRRVIEARARRRRELQAFSWNDDPRTGKQLEILFPKGRGTLLHGRKSLAPPNAAGEETVATAPPNTLLRHAASPVGESHELAPSSLAEPREPASPAPRVKGDVVAPSPATAATAAVAREASPDAVSVGAKGADYPHRFDVAMALVGLAAWLHSLEALS